MTTDPQSLLVSYRQAIPADAPTIRKVLWETWTATYGSFIPENDLRAYFENHYNDAAIGQLLCEVGVEGHVAECGNIAAGVMITRKNDVEGRFYVSSLYILPAFQGRGIGKGLLELARTRAMSIGMNALWLGVMVDNVQALAWYRSLGFTFVEELPFRMGKTKVSHLIGFLSLGQPKRSD